MSFRRFSLLVVLFNLGVILWGAYVRATGSGAGCGDHWPMCNGVVVPRAPSAQTVIEFTHRATSGLALLLVVALLVWAFRAFGRGHPVRTGAVLSMLLMLSEAAVGAGIVLYRLVAGDTSHARAVVMSVHLVNTFLLLAALTLTAWWAHGRPALRLQGQGPVRGIVLGGEECGALAHRRTLFGAQAGAYPGGSCDQFVQDAPGFLAQPRGQRGVAL
ncbi:MAG: COX15/CtaA family protein, partial [Myxococcales bacterium]